MKILQLTSGDARTGGAISVTRLCEMLMEHGHKCQICSYGNVTVSDTVQRIERSLWRRGLDYVARVVSDELALPRIYSPSTSIIRRAIEAYKPDVIHLHWTYGAGFIPLLMLPSLTRRFPLVWTFHDMYPFTGGCTASLDCKRWQDGCGDCPQQRGKTAYISMPPLKRDTTAVLWRIKRKIYSLSLFSIIGPSRWMTDLIRESPLLADKPIYHVANGLDIDFWKPVDKRACKIALGIAYNRKVLLFVGKPGDVFAYPGRRPVLLDALDKLQSAEPQLARQIVLVLVGEGGHKFRPDGYDVVAVQKVTSQAMLRICYNAADLLIQPTQFDNFPGTIQEALACGIPVVASRVGGIPDLVRHKENGYLARPDVPQEFADGVHCLLSDPVFWEQLSLNARRIAVEEYSYRLIAQKMADIYDEEITRHNK